MAATNAVLDLLRRPEPQLRELQRRGARMHAALIALGWLLLFSCAAAVLYAVYSLWQSGTWSLDWASAFPVLYIAVTSLRLFTFTDSSAALYEPVAALRAAVVNGDNALAPPADLALATPEPSPLPNVGSVFGPLRRLPTVRVFLFAMLGGIVAFISFLSAGVAAWPAETPEIRDAAVWIALGSTLWTLAMIGAVLWLRRPLRVRPEDGSLTWRTPIGRRARLPWRDARACFVFTERRGTDYALVTTYFLDGGRRVLVWRATPRDATPGTTAARRLAAEVSLRTGLTLRDVSAEASRIALLAPSTRSAARRKRADTAPTHRDGGTAVTPPKIRPSPLTWIVPLLLVVLVGGGVLGLQVYQTAMRAQLYAQAHSHAPCFADALGGDDGQWPVVAGSAYVDGNYQLTTGESTSTAFVPAPRGCGDALYEVSARTDAGFYLSGVGIAVRGPRFFDPLLALRVTPDGSWWLTRPSALYRFDDYKLIELENSAAIHKRLGSWNQIGVLVRGGQFTFYINGRYVTDYHDDALAGGTVGLYLDATTDSGSFKDYAVYPLT
jgi:hypothetical protein